jgi:hypothetical protein
VYAKGVSRRILIASTARVLVLVGAALWFG